MFPPSLLSGPCLYHTIARDSPKLKSLPAISSRKPGKTAKRVTRRATGKASGKLFRKLIK